MRLELKQLIKCTILLVVLFVLSNCSGNGAWFTINMYTAEKQTQAIADRTLSYDCRARL